MFFHLARIVGEIPENFEINGNSLQGSHFLF